MELPDKVKSNLPAVKLTAVGTAAVVVIVLQVVAFRVFGDIVSSAALFGLGYAVAKIRN